MKTFAIWVPIAALALASPAAAQKSLCFKGASAERCRGFLVTEFTFGPGTTTSSRRPPFFGDWEIGLLRNVGAKSAIGGTILVNYDEHDRAYLGVRPRYRRWLSRSLALDISGGLYVTGLHDVARTTRRPAVTARMGIMFKDWIGLTVGTDALRLGIGPTARVETPILIGLRLGGYAGLASWPLAAGFINFVHRFSD